MSLIAIRINNELYLDAWFRYFKGAMHPIFYKIFCQLELLTIMCSMGILWYMK